MTTVEILIAGRELIADPARWTQERPARDIGGLPVDARDRNAVAWCSLGALNHITTERPWPEWTVALSWLEKAARELYAQPIVATNDTRTHGEVLRVWDRAIELARAQEGKPS